MTLPTEPFPTHFDALVDECDGTDRPADEPDDLYEIADMVAAGATAKQVDHWTRGGYLHPAAREKATNGVARRWPAREREVCARMALLVDVGLSLNLAHDVARNPGAYTDRGVTIRIAPAEQTATAIEREILRYPGRRAVATALTRLAGEATAAADLLDDTAARVGSTAPPAAELPVALLLASGNALTGPRPTHSDHEGPTGA